MALAVTLTGRIAVSSNGFELDQSSLRGRRAQIALAVLVIGRHRIVNEHELADAMWSQEVPVSWRSGVRTAIAHVRAFFDRFTEARGAVVSVGTGSYRLRLPAGTTVDIEECPRHLATAEDLLASSRPGEALALARDTAAAAALPLMVDATSDWVDTVRRHLHAIRVRSLEIVAEAGLLTSDPRQALSAAEELVRIEPYHDAGRGLVMRGHAAAGNRGLALREYRRYRQLLADELGVEPSAVIEQVHADVMGATRAELMVTGAPDGPVSSTGVAVRMPTGYKDSRGWRVGTESLSRRERRMIEVGARVVVESEKVGVQPRAGLVTEVSGATVRVRWDDGHETSFVPAAGSMKVVEGKRPKRQPSR